MHERVVLRAQQHEVINGGLAAVRPVLYMVAIQEAAVLAARKHAMVTVPCAHCALDRLRHDARLAPDAEWLAVTVLADDQDRTVTAQALHRLDRQG